MNDLMNINWKEIKEKYPLAFYKFMEMLSKFGNVDVTNDKYGTYLVSSWGFVITNQFCYCDLEKFFDDNGIIIYILDTSNEIRFSFKIYIEIKNKYKYSDLNYWIRSEAKETAISKAFELLNEKLKKENKN